MCVRSMLARGCVFKKREGDTLKVADPVTCLLVRLIWGQEELVMCCGSGLLSDRDTAGCTEC